MGGFEFWHECCRKLWSSAMLRLSILTWMLPKTVVFCNVTPFQQVQSNRRFEEPCLLHYWNTFHNSESLNHRRIFVCLSWICWIIERLLPILHHRVTVYTCASTLCGKWFCSVFLVEALRWVCPLVSPKTSVSSVRTV